MPAYLVSEMTELMDQEGLDKYASEVSSIVEAQGGRYLALQPDVESMEGDPPPLTMVIIEFPSAEAAKALLDSDEYKPYRQLRQKSIKANIFVVDGL